MERKDIAMIDTKTLKKDFRMFMKEFNKNPPSVSRLRQGMLKHLEDMLKTGKIFFPLSPRKHGRSFVHDRCANLFGKRRGK